MARQEITKDGLVLIRDTDLDPRILFIETIYQGEKTKGNKLANIVPNVGDMVVDRTSGYPIFSEVVDVDDETLIPTFQEYRKEVENTTMSHNQQILGVGSGYQSETWRLYLDTSVVPHIMIPDSRLHVYGKENTRYKIFRGTDISKASGKVISMQFNDNGELIAEDIKLEKVAFPSGSEIDTNLSVKAPRRAYTTEKMENGEVVTLVVYNDEGQTTAYNTLLVHNTALDRNIESMHKYVASVALVSPFLDKTENNTLIFPMNMPHEALALMARITYSDGSSKLMAIDGHRVVLYGLDNYVPLKQYQTINLVLVYHLADDEMSLNSSTDTQNRFIAVKYFGRTTPVDGSYSVNLCPIPTWVSSAYGWQIRYYLYTLDRDVCYDVTDYIRPAANTAIYEPFKYGIYQEVAVTLNLHDVDQSLKNYNHVQTFQINLMGEPHPELKTHYLIRFEKDMPEPYGKELRCVGSYDKGLQEGKISIDCGIQDIEEWLTRVYYRSMPVLDKYTEKRPPRPSHFTVIINNEETTYPLRAWNQMLSTKENPQDGYGVTIQWSLAENGKVYQLGASPLPYVNFSDGDVSDHGGGTAKPEKPDVDDTIIDIDLEVKRITDRKASIEVINKYRMLLEYIKKYGLLRYEKINNIYHRIKNDDLTPAQIANDVILLEQEVNRIDISDFERVRDSHYAPLNMVD